ncbi:FadR/GntR family transcriptional regulator [Plantibacter sp. YIM 135347]|uniref:FadR/GntR family transcriptional regulator n=1 Tax=Plantibacter sp. YIM 135347 TaxID=3423919 RepID=UPI003D33EF09
MNAEPRAWETVLASIESDLLTGALRLGDRLPGERQLATDLGVGRSSVREAIRALEVLGLIRTHTGSGPTAGAIIVATPSGGMATLMRLQVAAQGFAVRDVVDTRLILETAVAHSLAAAHRTHGAHRAEGAGGAGADGVGTGGADTDDADALPDEMTGSATSVLGARSSDQGPDMSRPAELLAAMDQPNLTEAEFLALDAAFHVSLAEADGNQVIVATMSGLRTSIESYVLAAVPRLASWTDAVERLRTEHRDIIAAIESGDTVLARATVRDHIVGYYTAANLPLPTANLPLPTSTPTTPFPSAEGSHIAG